MKALKIVLLAAPVLLAGCQAKQEPREDAAPPLTFNEIMKDQIDLHADEVWEVTNKALDDQAFVDPAKMTDADWQEVARRADEVQKGAIAIQNMDPLVVAKPGVKIADEESPYGHTAAQVQARFDKNPQDLKNFAGVLAAHMGDIAKAARAHDSKKLSPLVDQLDGVCEDCHLEYWYPDQKELVNKYRNQI